MPAKFVSRRTWRFRQLQDALPVNIQQLANEAFKLFSEDPTSSGLRFKKLETANPVYSARISRDYRALAVLQDDVVVWFWIGSHAVYDRMIQNL